MTKEWLDGYNFAMEEIKNFILFMNSNKDEVITLSKLPNREGMLSMLLSVLQAPVRGFACAVKAVADKQ